jgi:hypothetical protein
MALAAVGTACRADELLMMPFSCSVAGGQPVLTPSRDEAYRILGPHEQRTFTACSPVNPDMCRQWTVHRFDLDCGGVRVPWASVATAADGFGNRRAWVEDGRVRIRMAPWWNAAPGDPCARDPIYGDRWQSGRFARYCADRRAMMAPPVVDMPFGFSPMLGTQGVFVAATGQRPGGAPPPGPSAAAAPAPVEAAPRLRSEPAAREAAPKDVPAKTKPAPVRQVEASPPPTRAPESSAPVAAPATPANPRIINRVEPPSEAPAATPTAPANPKVINRVEPQPEPPAVAALPKAAPAAEGAAKFAAHVPAATKEPTAQADPPEGTAGENTKLITVNLLGAVGSPSTTAVIACTALAMLVIAGFAWLLRRERAQFAGATSRDFASVSLGEPGRDPNISAERSLVVGSSSPSSLQGRPHAAPPMPSRGLLAGLGDAIPRTRAEALQVLGMGVTADAAEAAIKRIVDGLRLSWHPDYAKDPEDRRIRELRVKQINAAWEIIRGKRAEA